MPTTRTSAPKAQAKTDFFISRNKADKQWAVWIAWQLDQAGYSVVVQDWDFGPGTNFVLKMDAAIAMSDRTIAVLSPDFLKSEFTAPEWAAAFAEDPTGAKQKLIPIRVRRCSPRGLLAQLVRIDLLGLDEAAAKETLLAGVKRGRTKPTTAPAFPGGTRRRKPSFPGTATPAAAPRKGAAKPSVAKGAAASIPSGTITAKAAAEKIAQQRWGAADDRGRNGWSSSPRLGAVLVPGRQGTPYVDVLQFGSEDLQDRLRGLALVGPSAVLRSDRATETTESLERLAFTQSGDGMRGVTTTIEVYADGTLVYRTELENRSTGATRSIRDGHVIDESVVRGSIAAFIRFGNGFYRQRRRDPGTVYLGASLSGIQHRFFGQPPPGNPTSFVLASHRLEEPLRVPPAPLALTEATRRTPDAAAKTVVDHFARLFRVAGADYPQAGGRNP